MQRFYFIKNINNATIISRVGNVETYDMEMGLVNWLIGLLVDWVGIGEVLGKKLNLKAEQRPF
jgi:hypothetical protein